ncbi:hypothetical protein GINT2_002317 [Glugoides intestinalis]
MIVLPAVKRDAHRPKREKALYYFKSVKPGKDGFEFEGAQEIVMKDELPITTKVIKKEKRITAMNDLFFVNVGISKQIATVILRKNINYLNDPNGAKTLLQKPHFIQESEFESLFKAKLYGFCKIIENETIKIKFKEYAQKVVLNGDQIIFMLKTKIIIYTLFSSSVIEEKPVDIAVNRYLYILTDNTVLIYGETLLKKIEIDKKCNFIVPTLEKDVFFLIRSSVIYKVVNGVAEAYFDAIAKIYSCSFDDKHMYITTKWTVHKICLYNKEVTGIQLEIKHPVIHVCKRHILVHNSSSGVIILEKEDFSKFSTRSLQINLCGVATYNNKIGYSCSNEVLFFEFDQDEEALVEVNNKSQKPFKTIEIEKAEQLETVISEYKDEMPCSEYGITAMANSSKRVNRLLDMRISKRCTDALKKYESEVYGTTTTDELKHLISEIADSPIQILDRNSDMKPFKNEIINMQKFNDKTEGFIENQVEGSGKTQEIMLDIRSGIRSLMPSPRMTQYDYSSQKREEFQIGDEQNKKCIFDKEKSKNSDLNEYLKEIKDKMHIIKKKIKSINKSSKKSFELKDTQSESDNEEELFFEEQRNKMLKKIRHPLLLAIPKFKHMTKRRKKNGILDVFKSVLFRYGINHPLTYSIPLDSVRKKAVKAIILSKRYTSYKKSIFFMKNHIDFFRRRFVPRDTKEPERPIKGWINAFIEEEFNRIVGYKQNTVRQRIDVHKKKKGGF